MKIHLSPIPKNKNLIKYILIGILNTIFAYINGVVFFNLFYTEVGAFLLTLLTSTVNIFFTFINYKFFYFKTHKKFFLKELIKMNTSYFLIFFLNFLLLWFLIEKLLMNIYIVQFLIIIINIVISIKINFNYVFKN